MWGVFFGMGITGLILGIAIRPALDSLFKAIFR
jgi:hypothetical protein